MLVGGDEFRFQVRETKRARGRSAPLQGGEPAFDRRARVVPKRTEHDLGGRPLRRKSEDIRDRLQQLLTKSAVPCAAHVERDHSADGKTVAEVNRSPEHNVFSTDFGALRPATPHTVVQSPVYIERHGCRGSVDLPRECEEPWVCV